MDGKTLKRKTRIVRRDDGTIFTWSQTLDSKANFHAGWKFTYMDGTAKVVLDKASEQTLADATRAKREQKLIEENAALKQEIAELRGAKIKGDNAKAGVFEEGEVPLPEIPEEIVVPTPADAEEDIAFQPEPKRDVRDEETLGQMTNEQLRKIVRVATGGEPPARMNKAGLVAAALAALAAQDKE